MSLIEFFELLKYLFIGIIQGFTEPLPISSSAHMIFLNHYLQLPDFDLNFEIIVNFASTLAIFIFFFKDFKLLITNVFKKNNNHPLNNKFLLNLILASIPTLIIWLLLTDIIDQYFVSFIPASIFLLITSLMLFFCCYLLRKHKNHFNDNIKTSSAFTIGLFQTIALLPGISRSGSTLLGGISCNINIKKTLQFSFFLYLIASFGAFFLSLFKLDYQNINLLPLSIAFIGCFIATSFSIRLFYKKIGIKMLLFFAIYCLLVASLNLILIFN